MIPDESVTSPQVDESQRAVDRARLRRLFEVFSGAVGPGRSPVYAALTKSIRADDATVDLLDLLSTAPGEQRRPSLLFAAVNLLLAGDSSAGLAGYYPIHGGDRPVDADLAPMFTAFCREHRDELTRVLRERSTQTNEVRRCVALHLGLDHVQRRWPGPTALVEAGASAGLNLLVDRYRYRLNGRPVEPTDTSSVVVSCQVVGEPVDGLLGPVPMITNRVGLDRHPIDLSDPAARAWLEAFIWPEQIEELATLRGAIELALVNDVEVRRGDVTTDTSELITELGGDEPVVIFTASLLSYLSAPQRAAFVSQLDEAARRRPVAWVFAEAPGLLALAGVDAAALRGPLARRNDHYLVGASLRGADRDDRLLGLTDPYLRRLAPARHESDDFAWA